MDRHDFCLDSIVDLVGKGCQLYDESFEVILVESCKLSGYSPIFRCIIWSAVVAWTAQHEEGTMQSPSLRKQLKRICHLYSHTHSDRVHERIKARKKAGRVFVHLHPNNDAFYDIIWGFHQAGHCGLLNDVLGLSNSIRRVWKQSPDATTEEVAVGASSVLVDITMAFGSSHERSRAKDFVQTMQPTADKERLCYKYGSARAAFGQAMLEVLDCSCGQWLSCYGTKGHRPLFFYVERLMAGMLDFPPESEEENGTIFMRRTAADNFRQKSSFEGKPNGGE